MGINIAVIGLGNLGKRHLESIMQSTREWNVYGIDINADTLQELDELYSNKHRLKFRGGYNRFFTIPFRCCDHCNVISCPA